MTQTKLNSRARRQMLKKSVAAGALLAAILSATPVLATDVSWDAGGAADTSWTNATNWNANSVPTSVDRANITGGNSSGAANGTSYTATINTDNAHAGTVYITGGDTANNGFNGGDATVSLATGGTLQVGGQIVLQNGTTTSTGTAGTATFNMTGGTLVVNNAAANVFMFDGDGTVTLDTSAAANKVLTIAAANGTTANLNAEFVYDDGGTFEEGIEGFVQINNATNGGLVVFQTHQTVLAGGALNLASGSLGIAGGRNLTLEAGGAFFVGFPNLNPVAGPMPFLMADPAGKAVVISADNASTVKFTYVNPGEANFSGSATQTGDAGLFGKMVIGNGTERGNYTIGGIVDPTDPTQDVAGSFTIFNDPTFGVDGQLIIRNGTVTNTRAGTLTMDGGELLIKADPNATNATAKLVMMEGSTNAVANTTVDGGGVRGSAILNIETGAKFDGATATVLTLQDSGVLAITEGENGLKVATSNLNLHLVQGDGIVDVADGLTMTAQSLGVPNQGMVYGAGNLVKDGAGKLVLAEHNAYSGETRILDGELEIQGSLGYQDNAPYSGTAVYSSQIINNGTLTFDNTVATANPNKVNVQVLAGEMIGTGDLNQLSDNLLVLTGSNKLTGAGNSSDVVVGKVGQKYSALRVDATGSLHASGNLTVNSAGYNGGAALTRDHDYNLSTAILGSNALGYKRGVAYTSNTLFDGVAKFAAGSVWNVATSQIVSGDDVNVTVAKGGFATADDVTNANAALNAGNTMYFYSLQAQGMADDPAAATLQATWNRTARVSDIFINSLMLHNAAAIRMATTDRVDNSLFRMRCLQAGAKSGCGVAACEAADCRGGCQDAKDAHRSGWQMLRGNSIWFNYVGRSGDLVSSYQDAAGALTKFTSHGIQGGFDIFSSRRANVGVMFGYENEDAKLNVPGHEARDNVTGDDVYFGLYGGYLFRSCIDIRGSLGYGLQDYRSARYQQLGLDQGMYRAQTLGKTLESSLEVGRRFYLCGNHLSFRPVVGFDYFTNDIDGATEIRDAVNGRNQVKGLTYGDMKLRQANVRIGSDLQANWWRFRLAGGTYYSHLMNRDGRDLRSMVTDGEHRNLAVGSDLGQQTLVFNLGTNLYLNEARTCAAFGTYNGDYYIDRAGKPWGHNYAVGLQARF
ncbi:MAG: autotransporter domain-containing protein [Thermoguttaceae bacterium]